MILFAELGPKKSKSRSMKAGVDGRLYTSSMLLLSRTVRCLGGISFLNALLDCSQKDLIDAQVHEHSMVSLPTIAITTDQSSPSSSDIPHKRLRPRPRLSSRAVCRPASQPRPRSLELQNPNASLAASESTKWGVFPQVAQVLRTFATPVVASSNTRALESNAKRHEEEIDSCKRYKRDTSRRLVEAFS